MTRHELFNMADAAGWYVVVLPRGDGTYEVYRQRNSAIGWEWSLVRLNSHDLSYVVHRARQIREVALSTGYWPPA